MSYFKEEMSMSNSMDVKIITIEGRGAQQKAIFYPLKKTFDQLNSHGT